MRSYRCTGCRQRFPLPSFTQLGLSQVCSADCATTVRKRQTSQSPTPPRPRGPKGERSNDVPIQVRAQVTLRDKGRCRYCGVPASQLHHILYRSQGGGHTEENLIVLCSEHHDLMHSKKRYWQPLLQEVIRLLYSGQVVTIPEVERRMR